MPEETTPEEIEELIDFLYIKKQVIEGLEDFKQGKSYPLEEMRQITEKWKSISEIAKRQLKNIFDYFSETSIHYADDFVQEFYNKSEVLKDSENV